LGATSSYYKQFLFSLGAPVPSLRKKPEGEKKSCTVGVSISPIKERDALFKKHFVCKEEQALPFISLCPLFYRDMIKAPANSVKFKNKIFKERPDCINT